MEHIRPVPAPILVTEASTDQDYPVHRITDFRHSAVRVEVVGHSFYSGVATFSYEAEDAFKDGFLVK